MTEQKTLIRFEEKWKTSVSGSLVQPTPLENTPFLMELPETAILDVGCGTKPKGTVNVDFFRSGQNVQIGDQIQGESVDPHTIPNFVVADAAFLPFRSDCFDVVYSSHAIEHVPEPFPMFKELVRVCRRKVMVRCPHKNGTGAKRPFHLSSFDEQWFRKASAKLDLKSKQFVVSFDFPVTENMKKLCPYRLRSILEHSVLFRAMRHMERSFQRRGYIKTPFEVECWVQKYPNHATSEPIVFVVVYDNLFLQLNCFSHTYLYPSNTIPVFNFKSEGLPSIFNRVIKEQLHHNVWFAFCHQDFFINEDLQAKMKGKSTNAVYGVIGARLHSNKLLGSVVQTDGSPIGLRLSEDAPVETVDEMCLIVHSKLFRQGLRFDERFKFHFYGADLCMQAHKSGFDVLATQIKCEHKSKTLTGKVASSEYNSSLELFKEKWKNALPLRTTTKVILP